MSDTIEMLDEPIKVTVESLLPGDVIDLSDWWIGPDTRPELVMAARDEYMVVESVEALPRNTIVYLTDAPSNGLFPTGHLVTKVGHDSAADES